MPLDVEGLNDEFKGHELLQGYKDINELVAEHVKIKTDPPAPELNIPDEQKENPLLKDIKGPGDLINKIVDLGDKIMTPPDTPDGYKVEFPAGREPQDEAAKADFDAFKQYAHKELGLDPGRLQKLVDYELEHQDRLLKKFEEQRGEGWRELTAKYNVDEEKGTERALAVANKIGEDALMVNDMLSQFFGFGEKMHPAFAELMLKLESVVSEGQFASGDHGGELGLKKDQYGRPIYNYPSMQQG